MIGQLALQQLRINAPRESRRFGAIEKRLFSDMKDLCQLCFALSRFIELESLKINGKTAK